MKQRKKNTARLSREKEEDTKKEEEDNANGVRGEDQKRERSESQIHKKSNGKSTSLVGRVLRGEKGPTGLSNRRVVSSGGDQGKR